MYLSQFCWGLFNANNKCADQPARPRSLISAFVIRSPDSIITKPGTCTTSIHWLVSEAKQADSSMTLSQTPKTGYLATSPISIYCNSGNFRHNFIFAKSVNRHIYDAKNSRLGHDLLISVNDNAISTFREDFIFTKLRTCEVSRK